MSELTSGPGRPWHRTSDGKAQQPACDDSGWEESENLDDESALGFLEPADDGNSDSDIDAVDDPDTSGATEGESFEQQG